MHDEERYCVLLVESTVVPSKSVSDVIFCLQL